MIYGAEVATASNAAVDEYVNPCDSTSVTTS